MIRLGFEFGGRKALTVLCLGCHSDDIEIGCGGTILQLAEQLPLAKFHWVVFCAAGQRANEADRAASRFVEKSRLLGPEIHSFRDGYMPYVGGEVKDVFEDLKKRVAPDLILTQSRKDAHQDHRLVAELTWNTFRDHLILEYEIPKYDGDMGQPNFYVPLESGTCERKVAHIMECFQSQHARAWFAPETFLGLMRLRGVECNASSGYAEAFYCRKLTFCGGLTDRG